MQKIALWSLIALCPVGLNGMQNNAFQSPPQSPVNKKTFAHGLATATIASSYLAFLLDNSLEKEILCYDTESYDNLHQCMMSLLLTHTNQTLQSAGADLVLSPQTVDTWLARLRETSSSMVSKTTSLIKKHYSTIIGLGATALAGVTVFLTQ